MAVWCGVHRRITRPAPSVPSFLADMLAEVMHDAYPDDLVFTTWRGKPLRNLNFRRDVFDKAAEDADLAGLIPHELRHTAASLAVSAGVNASRQCNACSATPQRR
jgi:integrase